MGYGKPTKHFPNKKAPNVETGGGKMCSIGETRFFNQKKSGLYNEVKLGELIKIF